MLIARVGGRGITRGAEHNECPAGASHEKHWSEDYSGGLRAEARGQPTPSFLKARLIQDSLFSVGSMPPAFTSL
jgi:hypothetical protein